MVQLSKSKSKTAADGHFGYTKMAIDVMFGSIGCGFRLSLHLFSIENKSIWDLHTRTAVARNPCVSWLSVLVSKMNERMNDSSC